MNQYADDMVSYCKSGRIQHLEEKLDMIREELLLKDIQISNLE